MTFLSVLESIPETRLAVGDSAGDVDYGQLREQAKRAAGVLRDRHGESSYLLLPATRDTRFVVMMLGAMYSGNVPVPFDPQLPKQAVEGLRDRCGGVIVEGIDQDLAGARELLDARNSDLPAMVLFTSGTSGRPKGVVISQVNLSHSCRVIGEYLGYREYASAAVVLPLHYSYALLSQVCAMLYAGGRVRLFDELRNPLKFARTANEMGLQTFCGVPSTYQALSMLYALSPFHVDSVRVICSAGAAMDRGLLGTVKEIFPNAIFFDNYGMTEATPRISFIREDDPRFHEATCGRPIEGLEVHIVDPNTGGQVPEGDTGILALRGPNIASRYLNDPEATSKAFTEDGFLLSGDLAYVRDGYLYVVGRIDDVFNVGGEKVSPLEIERALECHGAVEAAGVVGIEDIHRGRVPVGFLVLQSAVKKSELVDFLSERLSMVRVPTQYFEVDSLPRTANGKLQRRSLSPNDENLVVREID